MGYKSNVLGVYVLNLIMMTVYEDNNRQTDIQTHSSQIHKIIYRVLKSNGYTNKVLGVHALNPIIMSVCEDSNRLIDRQMYNS